MIVASAATGVFAAEFVVGFLELCALIVFLVEQGRLPLTYLRWSVYQEPTEPKDSYSHSHSHNGIVVGLRLRSERVQLALVKLDDELFTARLAEAVTEARVKAATLNAERRHVRGKLPR